MCIVLNLRPFIIFSNNLDASDFLWAFPSTKVTKCRHMGNSHLTCHPVGVIRDMCQGLHSLYWGWSSHLLIRNPSNWHINLTIGLMSLSSDTGNKWEFIDPSTYKPMGIDRPSPSTRESIKIRSTRGTRQPSLKLTASSHAAYLKNGADFCPQKGSKKESSSKSTPPCFQWLKLAGC